MGKVGGTRPGAGRPKGALNKRTKAIHEMMDRLKCDPFQVLAKMATDPDISPQLRQRAASDLLPYIAPRLASQQIEHSGSIEGRGVAITSARMTPKEWDNLSKHQTSQPTN